MNEAQRERMQEIAQVVHDDEISDADAEAMLDEYRELSKIQERERIEADPEMNTRITELFDEIQKFANSEDNPGMERATRILYAAVMLTSEYADILPSEVARQFAVLFKMREIDAMGEIVLERLFGIGMQP